MLVFGSIAGVISMFLQFWGINPWHLLVLAFGRIIDNRTLRLITESAHSSPKTDKDIQDGNLRGNYFYLIDVMYKNYFTKVNLYSSLFVFFLQIMSSCNKIWLREKKYPGSTLTIKLIMLQDVLCVIVSLSLPPVSGLIMCNHLACLKEWNEDCIHFWREWPFPLSVKFLKRTFVFPFLLSDSWILPFHLKFRSKFWSRILCYHL